MVTVTFDIGTSVVKAVVVQDGGAPVFEAGMELTTIIDGEFREQRPEDWYHAFLGLSRQILSEFSPEKIRALIFSGQMQDVICVDSEGMALQNAILYSDGRASCQAERIMKKAGEKPIAEITGNHFDGSMPLAKILWLKENRPEIYRKTSKFLISSKDYVIGRLTGQLFGDVTACSTVGAMDLERKEWSDQLLLAADIEKEKFPKILYSHEAAGTVNREAAVQSGYREGTRVYEGTGDAGATTLASGILRAGEYNINLGTTGWVASVSDTCMDSRGGGFNLAAMEPGKYINVVPFFNGGSVHKFMAELLAGARGEEAYPYFSSLVRESPPGSRGVFFLPYLSGERFPVMDEKVRGTYLGIGQETTAADLARSALEGVAYSIRQGIETIGVWPEKITLIGGGAREEAWCRILCEVMGRELHVFRNPANLPALAIASSVFIAEGLMGSYREFADRLAAGEHDVIYRPNPEQAEEYDRLYRKYKTIYPAIRDFYQED